jgi:hypothetical protein
MQRQRLVAVVALSNIDHFAPTDRFRVVDGECETCARHGQRLEANTEINLRPAFEHGRTGTADTGWNDVFDIGRLLEDVIADVDGASLEIDDDRSERGTRIGRAR